MKIKAAVVGIIVALVASINSAKADGCCCKDKDGNYNWNESGKCE